MDEFHNRGNINMASALIAAGVCTQQRQHRAQAFTATIDNIMCELVDQDHICVQTALYQRIDGLHVRIDEIENRFEIHRLQQGA